MFIRSAGISKVFRRLISNFVLGFVVCFGLYLLYEWWFSAPGLGLTKHQFKDVTMMTISVAAGMALAEFIPPIRWKRSK
jgi:multisubunit Na+/H+ antiporter MnhB subunit